MAPSALGQRYGCRAPKLSMAMPVRRIDRRMHYARVPLSYIGPDGQHLDIELNFATWKDVLSTPAIPPDFKHDTVCEAYCLA